MAKTSSHAFIGGSRRTDARGGYRRKSETNSEGLKLSEIIAASPERLALIDEYRRGKRKEADDDQTGLREAQ